MRNYRACVSDPNFFVSSPGNRFHTIYSPLVLPDGTIKLEPTDKIDIRKEINSYRDSTDMSFILQRLNYGDTSVLNRRAPMYGDFTNAPKSMSDVLQMAIDSEKAFLSLPLETRQQYGNDFRKWLADIGSQSWLDSIRKDVPDGQHNDLSPDSPQET